MKNIEIFLHLGGSDPGSTVRNIVELEETGSYIYTQENGLYLTVIATSNDSYFKWSAYTIGHENYPAVFKSNLIMVYLMFGFIMIFLFGTQLCKVVEEKHIREVNDYINRKTIF